MHKFIFTQPLKPKQPASVGDVLTNYRLGRITLTEAKGRLQQFGEPSRDQLRKMRKLWQRLAPEAAKGLYRK